jgi:hypothetical protein
MARSFNFFIKTQTPFYNISMCELFPKVSLVLINLTSIVLRLSWDTAPLIPQRLCHVVALSYSTSCRSNIIVLPDRHWLPCVTINKSSKHLRNLRNGALSHQPSLSQQTPNFGNCIRNDISGLSELKVPGLNKACNHRESLGMVDGVFKILL